MSPKVSSATASVRTPGVWVAIIPFFVAASRSMWSNPTDMLATTFSFFPASRSSESIFSVMLQ